MSAVKDPRQNFSSIWPRLEIACTSKEFWFSSSRVGSARMLLNRSFRIGLDIARRPFGHLRQASQISTGIEGSIANRLEPQAAGL
jgi:hypothetical protein